MLKEKEIKQHGEYRTRRLVLEAWERLDGMEIGSAASGEEPREQRPVEVVEAPSRPEPPVQAVEPKVEPVVPEGQPMLSDFGLYKCGVCGKMVMGYEKEKHEQEKHKGKSVEWKKMR